MSIEQNKTTVRRYVEEVWNKLQLDIIDELFDTNYTIHQGELSIPISHEALRQDIAMNRTAFPDLLMTIDNLIAEGDKVAAHWVNRGTQNGELRLPYVEQSIPPSGKQVTFGECAIFRVAAGKLAEVWYASDRLSMMRQLGLVEATG
jgi:predicted ester cyclase